MKIVYGFDALNQPVSIGDVVMTCRRHGHSGCGGAGRRMLCPFVVTRVAAKTVFVRPFDAKPDSTRSQDEEVRRQFDEIVKVSAEAVMAARQA